MDFLNDKLMSGLTRLHSQGSSFDTRTAFSYIEGEKTVLERSLLTAPVLTSLTRSSRPA